MISLLLYESEAEVKSRMSVNNNNKDIIRISS